MNPTNGSQIPEDVLIRILKFADLRGINGCRLVSLKSGIFYTELMLRVHFRRVGNSESSSPIHLRFTIDGPLFDLVTAL